MGKSSGLTIVLAGARLFCLGVLALLSLPCDSSVGAVNFTFNGFKEDSLSLVSNSNWIFNTTTGCFHINPAEYDLDSIGSGRFLYPGAVQMIDPGSTTVKSFSTSFIYQLQIGSNLSQIGPGLAFITVPDNTTLGAPGDFMGLITSETSETAENYESDSHTFGVELDTYMNPGFNDTNNNHIGINLASMNSTYSFEPGDSLASSSADLYQQIWIDYFEADSRMDISYAPYGQDKPAKPQGSKSGLNLSLLKENMYFGFSSANKLGSSDVPSVCAWSFSNDGTPAPPIVIAQDATPGAPPPPAPVTPAPPPNGPVAAPSVPPPAPIPSPPPVPTQSPAPGPPQAPPLPSPSPISPSPNASATPPSASPPPFAFNPPPSSPLTAPSPGPGHGPHPINLAAVLGGLFAGLVVLICLIVCPLCRSKVWRRPLRIFISHTGAPNRAGKNFPSFLHREMTRRHWSRSKFRVKPFLDVENCPKGLSFAGEILKELERFDVGVVVVTPGFFERHWPMTELVKFVEVQKRDRERRIRVLPLFFKLTPDELKKDLDKKKWDRYWDEPPEDNHRLKLQECRDAVRWLCQQTGIRYVPETREMDYIDTILAEVDKILCRERSFAADLRWAMGHFKKKLRSNRTIT